MRDAAVFCIQKRQRVGNRNPVVPAQCCAVGADIVAVNIYPGPFFFQIDLAALCFVPDHIQMSLDDHGFRIFIPRRSLGDDEHVAHFILRAFITSFFGKSDTVVTQFLFMM